ncbi:MAG: hypothetical protein JXB13_22455 [Phycisphaerae bacterium]|nr:hypothetical protein [Phycisphaerae bacterium]
MLSARSHRHANAASLTIVLAVLAAGTAASAQITGGTFDPVGTDTVSRFFHAASRLTDGRVLVTGGLGMNLIPPSLFSLNAVAVYTPATGTFSTSFQPAGGGSPTTPTLLTARSGHTQTTLPDGRVLVVGGNVGASGTNVGTPTAGVEIFDPQTGLFTAGPSMAVARADHTATRLPDGRVVVVGGSTWQVFTPGSDTWSVNRTLARTRAAHAAVLLEDFIGPALHRVLIIGGSGSGPTRVELLNPDAGTAVLLYSQLTVGVDDLAAIRLADGRVFIVGGQNVSTLDTVSNTYLLDPATDTIVAGPPVPNRAGGIADHQIVRFTHYVAVFGGEQQVSGVDTELDYAALFDGRTDTWPASGSMEYTHDDFAAVPLVDCAVLLVSGGVPFLNQEVPSNKAEVFTLTLPDACSKGDLNDDGWIDVRDYPLFEGCLAGPDAGWPDAACSRADLDDDTDTDLADFSDFAAVFEEP